MLQDEFTGTKQIKYNQQLLKPRKKKIESCLVDVLIFLCVLNCALFIEQVYENN